MEKQKLFLKEIVKIKKYKEIDTHKIRKVIDLRKLYV